MKRLCKKYLVVRVALCCLIALCGFLVFSSSAVLSALAAGEKITVNARHIYPATQNSASISNVVDGSQINPRDWRQLTYGNASYVLTKLTVERQAITPAELPIVDSTEPPEPPNPPEPPSPPEPPNPPEHTVVFAAYGGAPAPDTQYIMHDEKVEEPGVMIKDGYTFGGWYIKWDFSGDLWDFDVDTVTGDIILYAKWEPNYYTVTFETNGGTPTPAAQTVAHGDMITSVNAPIRSGYTFEGWYASGNFYGIPWNFGVNTVTGNIILYAKWAEPHVVTGIGINIASTSATIYNNTYEGIPGTISNVTIQYSVNKDLSSATTVYGTPGSPYNVDLKNLQPNTKYFYRAGVEYSGGTNFGDVKILTTPAQIQSITSPVIENQSLNTVEETETEVSPNNAQDTGQELEQAGLIGHTSPESQYMAAADWEDVLTWERGQATNAKVSFEAGYEYRVTYWYEAASTGGDGGGGGGDTTTPTTPVTPEPQPEEELEAEEDEEKDEEPDDEPGDEPGDEPFTTPVGGSANDSVQRPSPPESGGRVELNNEGFFELIGEDGVPLGRYTLAADGETWIFEPYVPMGDLPQTGINNTMLPKTLLILGLLALTFGLYLRIRAN